jgi:hypothetical protein
MVSLSSVFYNDFVITILAFWLDTLAIRVRVILLGERHRNGKKEKMLDTCELCEEQETGVMFVNGLTICYECASLTTSDNEEELDEEEEAL